MRSHSTVSLVFNQDGNPTQEYPAGTTYRYSRDQLHVQAPGKAVQNYDREDLLRVEATAKSAKR